MVHLSHDPTQFRPEVDPPHGPPLLNPASDTGLGAMTTSSVVLAVLGGLATLAGCRHSIAPVAVTAGAPLCAAITLDADGDGLDDACETALAETFAPVVIHSSAETVFPTDVDDFLTKTSLEFRDDRCSAGREPLLVVDAPTQAQLLHHEASSPCDGLRISSDGSRSDRKHTTFFLADVPDAAKQGSSDTHHWKTYVHVYPSSSDGDDPRGERTVTIQYWRFYPFNRALANHGGDWEGLHVVLRRDRSVARIGLLGHRLIEWSSAGGLEWDGTHPIVYSDIGGHTSRASGRDIPGRDCFDSRACAVSKEDLGSFVRQETWSGGRVVWPDGRTTVGGGLVNVGEKSAPLNGQVFLQYSGLWGSPGRFYITSGYWGPAFNETDIRADGFVTAWCAGMAPPLVLAKECWGS